MRIRLTNTPTLLEIVDMQALTIRRLSWRHGTEGREMRARITLKGLGGGIYSYQIYKEETVDCKAEFEQ